MRRCEMRRRGENMRQDTINIDRIQRQSNQPSNFEFGINFHRSCNHFPFQSTHMTIICRPLIILYFIFFSLPLKGRKTDRLIVHTFRCPHECECECVCAYIIKISKKKKKIWESVFQFWTWFSNLIVIFVRTGKKNTINQLNRMKKKQRIE